LRLPLDRFETEPALTGSTAATGLCGAIMCSAPGCIVPAAGDAGAWGFGAVWPPSAVAVLAGRMGRWAFASRTYPPEGDSMGRAKLALFVVVWLLICVLAAWLGLQF